MLGVRGCYDLGRFFFREKCRIGSEEFLFDLRAYGVNFRYYVVVRVEYCI